MTQPFVDGHRYIPIDVNGDGRIDLARAKGTPNNPIVVAMLSVGDGTFALPTSTSSASSSMTTWDVDDHYVPGDLDQDGSTDFYQLVASPTAPTATLVALWNRSGAFAIQSYPGLPLTNGARNVRSYVLGDVGGDGRPDFTRISDGMLDQILLDVPGRRMTEERSGIGGRSTISYTTSTATGGNLPAGAVLPIVASVTSHDDITQQILDTTTYGFDDAVYDHRRRQLLGYRNGSTSTSRARTRTTYAVDDRCGARSAISTLETPTGAVLTRVTNSFVTNTTAPHVCLVASAVDEQCEGTGVCRRLGHTTTYDVYGNAVRVWQQGDLSDPLDDRLDESPVHPDTAKYIVSLPAFVNVSEWNRRWTLIKSTQYAYDGNGQLTSDGRWNDQNRRYITSQIVYDSTGNAIESRGPRTAHAPAGQKTTIAFDCTFQRFPERTCSGGACTTTAWNLVSGLPRSLTDENNETTTKTYDPLGRLIRTDLPVTGRYMRVDYLGAAGTAAQRIRIESSDESSDGVKWRETYFDGLGRPTKTIVEGGATNEVVYDAASTRIARHSTPYRSGDPVFWTESFYDSAGRATEIKLPDGKRRRTVFSVGAVATIDETGATTVTTADGYGRIAAIEEQLRTCQGGDNCTVTDRFATTYGYDVLGRMTWIRNAALMWTTNRYDSLSRRLEHCSPDEGCVATTYADDDLVESEVDVAGHRTLLKYDERGRPTERQVIANGATERTVTYTYVGGHLVEEIDTSDITRVKQLTWGAMGNIDRERTCIDGRCAELAFRYDRGNRLSEITYPDAKGNISAASPSFGYLYDDAGHLLGIPGVAVYAYDAAGHTTLQAFANAVFEQRAYDARRGWTDRIHVLGAGGDVLDVQLGHDPIGRVASASFATTSATSSFVYSHDDLGRMTSARTPTSVVTYRYDAINRRVWDSVHGFATYGDPLHPHAITRLDTGERYHYDVKGQLERSDALELRWNADGNPVEIRDANGVRTMYSYSADGERIAKRTNAGTERTFGDLVEIDSNGNLAFYIQANGKSIARVDGSGIEYFHRDHLDSIRATTDSSGRVTSDVQFGVWGERVAAVGAHRAPFGFVGARTDDNTGLVLLGARYYDPVLAQMASPDSILPDVYAPQLLNPFAYAMNDPASLADPSGHSPEGESQLDTSIARPLFYAAEVLVVARIDAEASSNSAVHSIPVYSEDRPPPGLPSEPPPTDYATWQAQQSIYAGLTPEAQDAWKSTHFDDLADSYINPWVRDLTSTVRWALMFDPTGLGSMKLDDVDEEMQWGDSSNGNRGVQDLMGMMAPTKLGIGAIAKVGRAATAKKRFDGVMVLEISTARIGGAQNKKLVLQKFTRANQALRKAAKEGVHYRAFSDAFSYSRNASKRFLREYFGLDVPLDSFTITSIIGKGNVDEIISRWLGGPQLMHNQHILPGFINQYLGSAEWSAIRRLGVKKGDPVTHYEIIFKD
ncbi:MAG: RHS repeat domain-containing protein [Kofleriaceae bacterium]